MDFKKAYDSVDMGYLDMVMGRMCFSTLWLNWIKECVTMTTASMLVNGSPTDEFPLERSLRQGDPLSPFLFLLAAEGLNIMMKAMVESTIFSGYSIVSENPVVLSNLQFADDTLILGAKSWVNVRALWAVIVLFKDVSGLKVNFHKNLFVGVNISNSWLIEAASIFTCKMGKVSFLYLWIVGWWKPAQVVVLGVCW